MSAFSPVPVDIGALGASVVRGEHSARSLVEAPR
jgi:hypothetical protein